MKSPISPVCLDFCQNCRFWSLEIADFRRLAIYLQAQIRIASRMSKIADLATYRQKWQHCSSPSAFSFLSSAPFWISLQNRSNPTCFWPKLLRTPKCIFMLISFNAFQPISTFLQLPIFLKEICISQFLHTFPYKIKKYGNWIKSVSMNMPQKL